MSREEARKAMLNGALVRHVNFTRDEYLFIKNGRITTEDGYFFGDIFDKTDWMSDGWSEFKCHKT